MSGTKGPRVIDSESSATEEARDTGTAISFERIGWLSGVIGSLSVIVSFVYDWGFFAALGISFADAPTTISDHIRSWLVWLPMVATAATFTLVMELLNRRVERGMTEDEIVAFSPSWVRRVRNTPYYLVAVTGPLTVVLWVVFGESYFKLLVLGLPVCWFIFSKWVFGHPTVSERHSRLFRLFVHWAPAVVIWVFLLGSTSAERDTLPPSLSRAAYTIHADDASSSRNVEILRSFEKWLLVREEDNGIAWIPVDDIGRMELIRTPRPFPGLACIFSKGWCPQRSVEENPDS